MKYVLMSGSFKKMEIYQEIIDFLNRNILEEDRIISFVSCDFDKHNDNDKFVCKLINLFKEKNYKFKLVNIIDDRLSKKEMKNAIESSNIIFMLGGDTLNQMANINKYGLKEKIRNAKIVIGISAGSINMAKKVVLAKDPEDNIPELSIYEGIGITDINIEPHCEFSNQTHWLELEKASTISDIVVMNDDAYIIVDKKPIYYGKYVILKNKEIYYNGNRITLEKFISEVQHD